MNKNDILRTVAFSALSLLALIPMWEASQVVVYFIGAVSVIALFSHVARKLFFPYIDLAEYAAKAKEDAIGSAIVFASVTVLICCILIVLGQLVGFTK